MKSLNKFIESMSLIIFSAIIQVTLAQSTPYCTASTGSGLPTCSLPVDQLGYGNLAPGTQPRSSDLLPTWFNIARAKQGQQFYNKYFGSIFTSYLYTALLFGMLPQGADILLFTGNSATDEKFAKRFTATAAQFCLWGRDVFDGSSNTNNIKMSLWNVRARHNLATDRCTTAQNSNPSGSLGVTEFYANYTFKYPQFWADLAADLQASNIPTQYRSWPSSYTSTINGALPLNQFLFSMVQWTISGLAGGFPNSNALLIHSPTSDELIGFSHLYSIIGDALGIDPNYNIGLQPNLTSQTNFYHDVLYNYFVPAMFNPCRLCKIITEVAASAFDGYLIPTAFQGSFNGEIVRVTLEALYIRILKDFLQIPATNLQLHSRPETQAFTTWYETMFIPSSYSPTFHATWTTQANAILLAAGVKEFTTNYTTDESIAQNVFV